MKFFIRTLGCKMNTLDSARITGALVNAGHQPVDAEGDADVVLVNTCTVTAEADRKSRQEVQSAARGRGRVAVFGCGPRVDTGRWREGSRLVFNDEQALLDHFGAEADPLVLPTKQHTRMALAVQTGCDNRCAFCITREARGAHRSIGVETVVEQVQQAHAAGYQEVVLTGINLAAWGCADSNRAEQGGLHVLLEALLVQTSMPRIRLSSLGPQYLHPAFFELLAEPRLCDYLHLSVQSGSDAVLQRMGRGHGTAEVFAIAEQARAVRPDVAIAADFITGFPGESEAEAAQTLAFAEAIGFAKLHVFPFSEREGTPAAAMAGEVPMAVRRERAAALREAGRRLRAAFITGQLGRRHTVLVESNGSGWSGNYIRLRAAGARGSLVEVTVSAATLADAAAASGGPVREHFQ